MSTLAFQRAFNSCPADFAIVRDLRFDNRCAQSSIKAPQHSMLGLRGECLLVADTVEKLDFLPRSQFLRQQAGFKKKALRVRQKS
jgi:hypothetical protein